MIDTCLVYRHLDTNHLHKHCASHNIILHPSLCMSIYWIMQIDSKIFIFCLSSHMTNDKEQQWSSKCKHHLWNMIMSESRGKTYFPKRCDNGNRERCSLMVCEWHRDTVYQCVTLTSSSSVFTSICPVINADKITILGFVKYQVKTKAWMYTISSWPVDEIISDWL